MSFPRGVLLLIALSTLSSVVWAIQPEEFTSGTGLSCTDSTCNQIYEMRAQLRGSNRYEDTCQQLWATAAYIFPVDAYSFGSSDGNCYYHHIYSPNSHIPFGSWANISTVDPKNNGPSCPSSGNPVNPAVGNKYEAVTDYLSSGSSPLQFRRFYNSATFVQGSRIGANWRSSYDRQIIVPRVGGQISTQFLATAQRPDGKVFYFSYSGGLFTSSEDITDRLESLTNGSGQLIGFRYTVGSTDEVETYDGLGKLTSITSRLGIALTLGYNTQGQLQIVTDSFGRQLAFTYDVSGRVSTMTDPAGGIYQYGYGASNNLISVTYPDNKQRTYQYNETAYTGGANLPNALTGSMDESNVRFATFGYNANGHATSTAHAGGVERYTLTYSASSTDVADSLGAVRTYGFHTILGAVRDVSQSQPAAPGCGPAAGSTTFDAKGNITSRTDFSSNQTTYTHTSTRNLEASRTEAYGTPRARTIATQWHPIYRLPTQIDEPGRRTTYTHDAKGNVLTKAVLDTATSQSRAWTYTYNSYGQVLTADGPRTDVSDVTTYTYYNCATGYQCGQVETITNALGQVTSYNTYNAHGQPLTITDPNGVVTTLAYDMRRRLTSRTIGTEQTSFGYWPTGLLKKAALPDGSYLDYTYDAAHRLTGIADAEGNRITYTLDAMGNRTAENVFDPSSALTQTRTHVFNTLNQLRKEIAAAGTPSVTTEFGYDNNGNQTSIGAPLGRNTGQTYDELNRLTQVTDPATGLTQYGYNALDQLISVTDPRNKVTSYTYNALGDLTQQVSPDTGTTTNTYDGAGNLKTKTDARNRTGTYGYDTLNRVTQLVYPDQTIAYTYDEGTNGLGRLTGISDASGSTAWGYDSHGRVTSRQQVTGSISKSVAYSYNTAGQLQSLTMPSGNAINYGYSNGKITSLTLNGTTPLIANVLYQPFGPTTGWTWGNATLAVREYDTDGKVTDIDSAGLKSYAYDDAFRITGVTDAGDPNLNQAYGYDLLDRLTSAIGTGLNQSWTYDSNGNRLTQGGTQASTFTIAAANNRISSSSGSLNRTYTYDAAGNTTGDGAATFTYDDAGRLVSATKAGVTTDYKLNALGQRVRKITSGTSAYFAYDEAGHLVGEYDNAGNLIQETIWFDDTPVVTLKSNDSDGVNVFYIHTDHLNTPRRISRPSDNVIVWRWDSDPFGTTAANEDPDGDSNLFSYSLRFPGQYYDNETGLHYNYFRDYDSATGRYVQSDPIGLDGGINTYAYVRSAPNMIVDPSGLSTTDYFACLLREARYGGAELCRQEFFATAEADASREFERRCEVIGEGVACSSVCAFENFVGANFPDAAINAHKQVAIRVLNKIAKETASKAAKRFLPIVGQIDLANDVLGTVRCSTSCVKN